MHLIAVKSVFFALDFPDVHYIYGHVSSSRKLSTYFVPVYSRVSLASKGFVLTDTVTEFVMHVAVHVK